MRILWVKAGKLLPVDTGGKIRSYNILRYLANRHETTLLSYYPGPVDTGYEADLKAQFPGAEAIAIGGPQSLAGQVAHYAQRAIRLPPYSITKFTSPLVRQRIEALQRDRHFDVAVSDFLAASLNFPLPVAIPTVLFQHNVESALWQRQARHEANPMKRAVFTMEAAKMFRYERQALSAFSHIIAVSDVDRQLMAQMEPRASITVVPTGVDVALYRRPADATERPLTVMFLGSMDWPANVDGVEYFCAAIWPRIVAAVPGAVFRVVGRRPPPRIQRLASDSVEIVGGVESVQPHLHSASVFVVPLRIGGGTRLKIYEAMAAALPIVSTTIGAEGLDVVHGEDILLADDPVRFADEVIELLRDERGRTALATAAATTAARFDWPRIGEVFSALLETVAGQGDDVNRPVRDRSFPT